MNRYGDGFELRFGRSNGGLPSFDDLEGYNIERQQTSVNGTGGLREANPIQSRG